MLTRTLEPEVMDTAEEAEDYDSMDHSQVNQRFVDDWYAAGLAFRLSLQELTPLLDVGTGTALIPIEYCQRFTDLRIVAIDLADEMLKLARRNVERAGFRDRIDLLLVDAKGILAKDGQFPGVVSNSIIHHIPNPIESFREMARVLAPGGLLFVRDLLRPETELELERLVATYAGNATARQRQLFRQSLHAALTVEEVQEILTQVGLQECGVAATSDRHWTVCGRKSN